MCVNISLYCSRTLVLSYTFYMAVRLKFVNKIRDLGITLSLEVSFNVHIDAIHSKSFRMLGFIKRLCSNFNSSFVL